MRVAVLGAGGTIAPAIVRDLAESEEVTALRLLDIDLRRAEAVATEHGGGKAQARQADATERPRRAARRHGGAGQLGRLPDQPGGDARLPRRRLPLHGSRRALPRHRRAAQALGAEFEQRGLLALLGIGSAPGKTNLLAARAVRELPGKPVSISVLAAGRDLDPPEGLSFPYAVRTLLDEITMAPMALINGRPQEMRPLQDGPSADFGDPIGVAETIFTLHSEVLTFGDSFGAPNVTFALSLSPQVLESLKELPGASEERIAEVARSASPPSANTALHPHRRGRRAGDGDPRPQRHSAQRGLGSRRRASSPPRPRPPPRSGCSRAAASRERGALPPESCIDPDEMFAELEARGVRFDVSSSPLEKAQALSTRTG